MLDVRHLKTYYYPNKIVVKAVDDVSFTVRGGEALGVAGESGCGKSTLAMSLLRLVMPPGRIIGGDIILEGESILNKTETEMEQIRWKKISVVFQDSMNALNPVLKVGEQIAETFMVHEKMSKREAWDRTSALFRFVGIEPSRVYDYPHEFSGGMRQRAMIAMALALNSKLIILDEPTTALDVIVQAQVLDWIKEVQKKLGLAMILITHDLSVLAKVCSKIAVFYAGKIVEKSPTAAFYERPRHPYSQGLLRSFPSIRGPKEPLVSIPGFPSDLSNPPVGCRFHPRCHFANDVCREREPEIVEVEPGHQVACHKWGEICES